MYSIPRVVLALSLFLAAPIPAMSQPPKPKPKPTPSAPRRPAQERAGTPTVGTLLIQVDAAADVRVDGKPVASVAAGEVLTVPVSLGQHIVQVTGRDRTAFAETRDVDVKTASQVIVRFETSTAANRQPLTAEEERRKASPALPGPPPDQRPPASRVSPMVDVTWSGPPS